LIYYTAFAVRILIVCCWSFYSWDYNYLWLRLCDQ